MTPRYGTRLKRNTLLFSMLYHMKLVEQIGSGIRRIHEACGSMASQNRRFRYLPIG